MQMIFPNANNFQIPRALFIAAWKVWFKRFSHDHYAWREGQMPLSNKELSLYELLESGHRFSVESLSRLMVPWSYRDTLQVNEEMMKLNPAVLRLTMLCDMNEEGSCEAARLTDQALDFWDALTFIEQDIYLNFAEARIQADIETPHTKPVVLDDYGIELIGEDIYPPIVPDKNASDDDFLKALVAWIDEDPYQPMYQRQPVGDAVSSWHDRFMVFFWPKPRTTYNEYSHAVSPLMYRMSLLAEKVDANETWNMDDKMLAEKTANEIFMLAGLPQREVTWENVHHVVTSALNADMASTAKMNSGWTYIACLATAHLEEQPNRLPMLSWNSRTSTSIISRLDFLLTEAGITELDGRFEHLGIIPGLGGTRPREFTLNWPSAYRSWSGQVAASRLAKRLCDILNTETRDDGSLRYTPMPIQGEKTGLWTVRGVMQVLFSDGY